MITHYSLITSDPTTQAHLAIITESNEGPLTLSIAGQNVEATGTQIPARPEYIYHFRVSGLLPGRLHPWSIPGLGDGLPLKTLPGAMPPGGLCATVVSDIHVGVSNAMGTPSEIDILAAQNTDFALFAGDHANSVRRDHTFENGGWWITLAADYLSRLSSTFLMPMYFAPGNHDVGNGLWEGTAETDENAENYFLTFFPNNADIEPLGTNYAAPIFGDWMQLFAVDTHSTTALTTAAWAPGAHNADVPICFPIQHSPTMAADIRFPSDPLLQANMRNAVSRLYIEAENIKIGVVGHVHARTRSKQIGIVETDPGGNDKFELADGGFIVAQEGGYIEVGQGFQSNRINAATQPWFLDYAARNEKSFQRIDISQGAFRFRTIRDNGATVFDQTWQRPRSRRVQPVLSDGSLSTAVNANGWPVYPVAAVPDP